MVWPFHFEIKKASEYLEIEKSEIPDHPKPEGTIINSRLKIGIWIMPDNKSPGEIEDFAVQMVPENDLIWPSSREDIDKIPEGEQLFSSNKKEKAQLFAWLATRKEPGRKGAAVGAGHFDLGNSLNRIFLKWLSDLFPVEVITS